MFPETTPPLLTLDISGVVWVIITARQSLTPSYERILIRLVNILGVVSKNPSNPKFHQFIFESISGLMRSDDNNY
jgi:hypothetical protein